MYLRRSRKRQCENPRSVRSAKLKSRYGITVDDYDRLLAAQGNGCAICGGWHTTWENLCVDHDHETGRVRGLLCNNCNQILGRATDSTDRLRAAIAYLERSRVTTEST